MTEPAIFAVSEY